MASSNRVRLWRDLLLPPRLIPTDDELQKEKSFPSGLSPSGPFSTSSSAPSSNLNSPVTSEEHCSIDTAESGGDEEDDPDDYIVQLAHQMAQNIMLQEEGDEEEAAPIASPRTPKFWGLLDPSEPASCELGHCESPKGVFSDESTVLSEGFEKMMNETRANPAEFQIHGDYSAKPGKATKQERERPNWGRRAGNTGEFQNGGNRNDCCGGPTTGRRHRPRQQKRRTVPPPQPAAGSGMMAVFLGGGGFASVGGGGSSCGTGVFLPPGIGHSTESRKNPGYATALIPARVVQALGLKPNDMGVLCRSKTSNFHQQQHYVGRNNGLFSQEPNHHDMGLPQEWTY